MTARIRNRLAEALALCALLALGCGQESHGSRAAGVAGRGREASSMAERCTAAQDAFALFVSAHLDCSDDSECTVIGDCGPNADYASVQASVATEALLRAAAEEGVVS